MMTNGVIVRDLFFYPGTDYRFSFLLTIIYCIFTFQKFMKTHELRHEKTKNVTVYHEKTRISLDIITV